MTEVPDIIKSRVRAFLLSCTNHKEPMHTFEVNYGKLYKKLNLKELGFNSLHSFMSAIPDAVGIQREGGQIMLIGIPTEQNKHIVDMIEKQKKPKKKPTRDSMIFPRFQAGGGRISYPANAIMRPPYRPPPARFKPPPQPSSHFMHRSLPKPAAPNNSRALLPHPNTPSHRKIPSPSKTAVVQDRFYKLSVHDRLGPAPNASAGASAGASTGTSNLAAARRRVEAAREAAKKESGTAANRPSTLPPDPVSSRRSCTDVTEPLEIRIDGDSHRRTVSLKSPTDLRDSRTVAVKESPISTESPASVETAVCEVDSDGGSDEPLEFPVDADFLRMLVFYVISEADTARNWVSASGLGSRMRRRLAKAGVETPPAIGESILKFMQYEWKDMFDCSNGERGDCCQLNTPFRFSPAFREAYSANVEPLVPQLVPSMNETLSAFIVHVESSAFYVRLVNDQSEEILAGISEELANEFLSSEPNPDDVFTFRKNEMCAVCVDHNGSRVWRRGRLEAFLLLGDELDEQTSELTAFMKVFLVDCGELVNVRAGDVRPLPKRLFTTQALAYRCMFQGARLDNLEAFDRMMRKYVNEQVELQVHSEQSAEGLMTLQVRIQADSYVLDDLVHAKVATRVTCGDPDPAHFPPDVSVPVSFIGWRYNCRSALVKLNHPEQQQRLYDLEAKLTEAVAGEISVSRFIVNNVYVWRRPSEHSRRVRCVSVSADGAVQVYCLDHGCSCRVTPNTDLCLPTTPALMTLMSGTHYFITMLKLALLPPSTGEDDAVRRCDRLKDRIRALCSRGTALVARHETLVSESPSFMLYPVDGDQLACSLNCALLHLLLDMRFWAANQSFKARLRPLPEANERIGMPNGQCLVVRLDAPNCRPYFEAHGREFRYLQRCCLDFTAKAGDSVMCRLSDLPENTVLSQGTKLVYRQLDAATNSSLMCRVELLADFVGGSATSVPVSPSDDPLLSMQMDSAPAELLFTVPLEWFGARPLERFSDDLEPKELELFCEFLQHLPAVDQLALAISPPALPESSDVAVEAEFTANADIKGRQFPLISLRAVSDD